MILLSLRSDSPALGSSISGHESEAAIVSRLPEITKNRTVISIAHRLNTINQCDRIMVIEKGQVVESGNHHKLLADKAKYARLCGESGWVKVSHLFVNKKEEYK